MSFLVCLFLQKTKGNTEAVNTHMQGNNKSGSHKKQKKKSVAGLAKVSLPIFTVAALFPYPLLDMFLSESDTCPSVMKSNILWVYIYLHGSDKI